MKTFSVAILLLLSATITAALDLNGVYSVSNRAQAPSFCQITGGLCSELVCSPSYIELILKVAKLKEMNVHIPSIHLRDRRCTGFAYNDEYVYLKWALGTDICGTERAVNNTHVTWRNHVYLPLDPAGIIYREEFILNVSCTYPRYLNGSNDIILIPEPSTTVINIDNYGEFKLKIAIYKDISYTTPYTDSPIRISTKSNLYVGVYIAEADISYAIREFNLLMINCYSTPSNNMYDSTKYDIILNRCPNPSDSTIRVLENGVSTQGKFYIQMFKFIGDYSEVYLHCQVYLCINSCAPSCSSVKSRSETPQPQGSLTIGPIQISDNGAGNNDAGNNGAGNNGADNNGADSGAGTAASFSMLSVLGLLLADIFIM